MTSHNETRKEHLRWAKERADAYLDADMPQYAWQSMVSDLRKDPRTEDHAAIMLGMMLAMSGHMETTRQVREFVDGIQ